MEQPRALFPKRATNSAFSFAKKLLVEKPLIKERSILPYILEDEPAAFGGFSEVYKGRRTRVRSRRLFEGAQKLYAVKISRIADSERSMSLQSEKPSFSATDRSDGDTIIAISYEDIAREIKLMKLAQDNEHVVRLHEVFTLRHDPSRLYMVMDYMFGSLEEVFSSMKDNTYIRDRENRFKCIEVAVVAFGLLRAVEHLKEKNVVHLDIKPANVLLSDSGQIKLCDFGSARLLDEELELDTEYGRNGTPQYMAPELFMQDTPVDFTTDVWSVGLIIYEMYSGALPWGGVNDTITHFGEKDWGNYNKSNTAYFKSIFKGAFAAMNDHEEEEVNEVVDFLVRTLVPTVESCQMKEIERKDLLERHTVEELYLTDLLQHVIHEQETTRKSILLNLLSQV